AARPRGGPPALLRAGGRQLRDAATARLRTRRAVRKSHLRHHHGPVELADGRHAFDSPVLRARLFRRHVHPLHGHVADRQRIGRMSAATHGDREGRWAWRLTGFVTLCVYIFLFAPIIATVVLSFNASMFGGFPMTGFSLQWYGKLLGNEQVLAAFRTSMWIALVTAVITTAVGVVTAYTLIRFEFRGKQMLNTLVILPALVPETILG